MDEDMKRKFESIEELAGAVKQAELVSLPMEAVREAYGAGRLGVHVRKSISAKLAGEGIGHYPPELPDSQREWVRLFHEGSSMAELMNAVLNPNEENDKRLKESHRGDLEKTIRQIRELVCD